MIRKDGITAMDDTPKNAGRPAAITEAKQFIYDDHIRPVFSGYEENFPGLWWYDFGSSRQHPCVNNARGRTVLKDGDWIVQIGGQYYAFTPEVYAAIAQQPEAPAARLAPDGGEVVWEYSAEDIVSAEQKAFKTGFNASEAGFKNFHRSLCSRFGYVHDEKDWRRDLVSLEEHIASMASTPASEPAALTDEVIGTMLSRSTIMDRKRAIQMVRDVLAGHAVPESGDTWERVVEEATFLANGRGIGDLLSAVKAFSAAPSTTASASERGLATEASPDVAKMGEDLKLWGVSRDADLPTALSIFFSRAPTDDEMRGVHELLARRAAAPAEPVARLRRYKTAEGHEHWEFVGNRYPFFDLPHGEYALSVGSVSADAQKDQS